MFKLEPRATPSKILTVGSPFIARAAISISTEVDIAQRIEPMTNITVPNSMPEYLASAGPGMSFSAYCSPITTGIWRM